MSTSMMDQIASELTSTFISQLTVKILPAIADKYGIPIDELLDIVNSKNKQKKSSIKAVPKGSNKELATLQAKIEEATAQDKFYNTFSGRPIADNASNRKKYVFVDELRVVGKSGDKKLTAALKLLAASTTKGKPVHEQAKLAKKRAQIESSESEHEIPAPVDDYLEDSDEEVEPKAKKGSGKKIKATPKKAKKESSESDSDESEPKPKGKPKKGAKKSPGKKAKKESSESESDESDESESKPKGKPKKGAKKSPGKKAKKESSESESDESESESKPKGNPKKGAKKSPGKKAKKESSESEPDESDESEPKAKKGAKKESSESESEPKPKGKPKKGAKKSPGKQVSKSKKKGSTVKLSTLVKEDTAGSAESDSEDDSQSPTKGKQPQARFNSKLKQWWNPETKFILKRKGIKNFVIGKLVDKKVQPLSSADLKKCKGLGWATDTSQLDKKSSSSGSASTSED